MDSKLPDGSSTMRLVLRGHRAAGMRILRAWSMLWSCSADRPTSAQAGVVELHEDALVLRAEKVDLGDVGQQAATRRAPPAPRLPLSRSVKPSPVMVSTMPKTSPNSSLTMGPMAPSGRLERARSILRRSASQIGRMSTYSSRMLTKISDTPVFEVLVTESSSGISWIASSIGSVISCSTRSGLPPGKVGLHHGGAHHEARVLALGQGQERLDARRRQQQQEDERDPIFLDRRAGEIHRLCPTGSGRPTTNPASARSVPRGPAEVRR